jgi:hypothetical protein
MEWISIADKLPPDGQMVLCYIPDNNLFINYQDTETRVRQVILKFDEHYYGQHNIRCSNNKDSDSLWVSIGGGGTYWFHQVTYWMPLPEPPNSFPEYISG